MKMSENKSNIKVLLKKGVKIPNPENVEIGDDIDTNRISGNNVVIHSGCKIYGKSTLILQGTKLGYEGPAIVENCQIGPDVELKAGFFSNAVFLGKSSMGSGSHVREGTILEEEASGAHTVGLKQTILFPFVTLGSLINFCDCFMSGGTNRKNHSEVGSSYIHFNFTPNQDKATGSLIGDVPNGVMLNQPPIFLGGQGGLVGPCRLAFGTTIAAGSINRKDELRQGHLLFEGGKKGGSIPFTPGKYQNIKRIVNNNVIYIANLIALDQWYKHVRSVFISDMFPEAMLDGLREKLNIGIDERIKRVKGFAENVYETIKEEGRTTISEKPTKSLQQKLEIYSKWAEIDDALQTLRNTEGNIETRDIFLERIQIKRKETGKDYISLIKDLEHDTSKTGTIWLQGIIDHIVNEMLMILPSYK
jgi:UDP-N-acetylglucosamine/UDP-N-acetylgalactosamine diphosphorylase